eukprot:sb/3466030/
MGSVEAFQKKFTFTFKKNCVVSCVEQFSAVLKDAIKDNQARSVLSSVRYPSDADVIMAEFLVEFLKEMNHSGISPHQSAITIDFFCRFIKNTCNTKLVDALRTLNLTLPKLTCLAPNQALSVKFDAQLVSAVLKDAIKDNQARSVLSSVRYPSDADVIMAEFLVEFLKEMNHSGISPHQSAITIDFFCRFIKNTCNTKLVDALRTLNLTLPKLTCLAPNQLKFVLEYLSGTYLKHYNLYKYVMTLPQEQDYTLLQKEVLVPDESAPLSTGVDDCLWRYNERVKEIGEEHNKKLASIHPLPKPLPQHDVAQSVAYQQQGFAFTSDQLQPVMAHAPRDSEAVQLRSIFPCLGQCPRGFDPG